MKDLENFTFDITEAPAPAAPAAEDSGAPQFKPDFGVPERSAARREEGLPREEFRMPLTTEQLPREWQPVGAWKLFGCGLLFALPVIGLIFAAVFSFTARNLNVRSFARSVFCWLLVLAAVLGILFGVAWFTGWWQRIDFARLWQDIIQYDVFTK